MPTLPKFPPSSLRPDPQAGLRNTRSGDPRPYLISGAYRRTETTRISGMNVTAMTEQSMTLYPHESEDARLTGSTRSLFRRLLALNLPVATTEASTAKAPALSRKGGKVASA